MWVELENTFSNNEVTQMEDTLKAEKLHLLEIYQETQAQSQVRKQQNMALGEKETFSSKIMKKNNKFTNELRECKAKLKHETEMQRKIISDIKLKQAEIQR